MIFSKLIRPAAVSLILTQSLVTAQNLGQWGPTIQFPIVPVAATIIVKTGELLVWSAFAPTSFETDYSNMTQTAVYSPSTGTITQYSITNTGHDMFCPGISIDFNGRTVVTGGDTASRTSINTGTSDAWISGPNMVIPRGYQSSATCSDGRIFTIGGSWSGGLGGKNGEIYNPSTNQWTLLPGCPVAPMLTNDNGGIFRQDNHAWLHAWKNGYVLQAGPSKAMNWYQTQGNGGQSSAGVRGKDGDAMTGVSVMYDAYAGKIFTAGGAPSYQDANATANAHVLTIKSPGSPVSVHGINPMHYPRSFANGIVLPDGKVLIVGGQSYAIPFTDSTPQLTPELWDPVTTKFTKLAPGPTPRNYHSIGILMPDGRVFSGGGGLCGACETNHEDGQFFSPPYLFNADGSAAARPTIKRISSYSVGLGGSLTVTTRSPVVSFSFIRISSVTHTVNTDQRRIPLTPKINGLTYTVTLPKDPGVVLPGYWMLFALNAAGVPSTAKIVHVLA